MVKTMWIEAYNQTLENKTSPKEIHVYFALNYKGIREGADIIRAARVSKFDVFTRFIKHKCINLTREMILEYYLRDHAIVTKKISFKIWRLPRI